MRLLPSANESRLGRGRRLRFSGGPTVNTVNFGSKLEIERFSVTSSKTIEKVVPSLKAAVGQPAMAERKSDQGAQIFAELERAVQKGLGRTGLMILMKLDLGAILRRETGRDAPKVVRFIVGNPLIMKEMVRHIPDAGSYAPVTILVDERSDGVHLSYDRMTSLLAPYGNRDALAVARDLDSKSREPSSRKCDLPKLLSKFF